MLYEKFEVKILKLKTNKSVRAIWKFNIKNW